MKGKVVIITGSSAGLGKEAALQLLDDGADVIFACRDKEKTMAVINSYKEKTNNKENANRAHFYKLDLTSFEDVFRFAEEIKKDFPKIDVLMNNAGHFPTTFTLSKDGIESCLQANHLSHMLLSFLLLDNFDKNEGKIINVSSMGHMFANFSVKGIAEHQNFEKFADYEKFYLSITDRNILYGNTKLANIYFSKYLTKYLEKHYPHIKSASLHPGGVNTEFTRFLDNWIITIIKFIITPLMFIFVKSPLAGAQTQLHLTYMDNKELVSGAYYKDCAIAKVTPLASSEEVQNAYIDYSWKLIKGHCPENMKNKLPQV